MRKLEKIRERSPRKADEVVSLLTEVMFAGERERLGRLGFSEDKARTLVRDVFAGRDDPRRIVGILENLSKDGDPRDMKFVEAIRRGDKTGTGVIAEVDAYEGLKAHENGARNNCAPFRFGVHGGQGKQGKQGGQGGQGRQGGEPDFIIPGCARYYPDNIYAEVYRKQIPSWKVFADRIAEKKAKELKVTLPKDGKGYGVVVADVRASDLSSLSGKRGVSVNQRLDAVFAKALRDARSKHSDRPLKGIRVVYEEGNRDVALTYYWDETAGAVFRTKRGDSPWSWELDFGNGEMVKQ